MLRLAKEKASLGFMRMDIIHPPEGAIWGEFNNRSPDEPWIARMAGQFETYLDNCCNEHSMDVTVDPKWLKDPSAILKSVDGYSMENVPLMEFTQDGAEAIKHNNLWMLSGNHRRLALVKYIDKLKADVENARNKIEEMTEGKTDEQLAALDNDAKEALKRWQELVSVKEPLIDSSCFWTVRIFDRGACYWKCYRNGGLTC